MLTGFRSRRNIPASTAKAGAGIFQERAEFHRKTERRKAMRKIIPVSIMLAATMIFSGIGAYAGESMQEIIMFDDELENGSDEEWEENESLSEETEADDSVIEFLSDENDDGITILSSDNASSDDDDGDDEDEGDDGDDEEEEETEDPNREPREIPEVIITNISYKLQPGTSPKYTARVEGGNAKIIYEGWSDNHGNANYSLDTAYKDTDKEFDTFKEGELYWYHLCIGRNGKDYFSGNTSFIINGKEMTGKFNPQMTVCTFDQIFTRLAQCDHQYKTYKTAPTCTQAGAEYKKCTLCGQEIDRVTIPATGHKYELDEDNSIQATCTMNGLEVYECQNEGCGDVYSRKVQALGHHLVTEVEDAATKNEAGTYTVVCTREDCGYSQKTQSVFPYKKIVLSKSKYGYTGGRITPPFRVTDIRGVTISPNYYTTVYYGNKNVGTATIHITFTGMYSGKLTKTFQIVKGSQKISVSSSAITVPKGDVKKKPVKFNLGAKAKTKLSFKSSKPGKVSVSKKGTVTVKKGAPKGTYTITITAKGTGNWKKATKKVKIKVK